MAQNEVNQYNEADETNTDITGTTVVQAQMYPYHVDDAFRKLMGALKRTFRSDLFRLRDSTDQTKLLAFDLSGISPSSTQTVPVSRLLGVDSRRNHDVNGDMAISQENGSTTSTANGFFPADQWALYRVTSAGTITVGRVSLVTPAGATARIRITITAADASLAAGEYLVLSQNLEGSNVSDHKYGTLGASASVRRFGIRSSIPLTFAFSRQNAALNRSWVGTQTIPANTDSVASFAIPGDTAGTWLTSDGSVGFTENIVLACGSTFQGVAGWQAGNIYGTSGVTNGMGTLGAVFEIFDTGEKLDPDATGVYGAYQVGEVNARYQPSRYWNTITQDQAAVADAGGRTFTGTVTFPPMSKQPTVAVVLAGTSNNVASHVQLPASNSSIVLGFVSAVGPSSVSVVSRVLSLNARI